MIINILGAPSQEDMVGMSFNAKKHVNDKYLGRPPNPDLLKSLSVECANSSIIIHLLTKLLVFNPVHILQTHERSLLL